uniref:Uncharacterized protein n=2 Tax=Oryza TaxID=4527 RepID=Q2R1Q7_ORYSJ|nr:hypothetical protein LOC_Os11g38400 [Oryza sativa Japonica Group]
MSEDNLDGDDGGSDDGREYRRAKQEDELKRRWISSMLAMADREVDAGVVDPDDDFYYKSLYVLHESSKDLRHVRKKREICIYAIAKTGLAKMPSLKWASINCYCRIEDVRYNVIVDGIAVESFSFSL